MFKILVFLCFAIALPLAATTRKDFPELGITELLLANGMRICLKPTAFDDDEVVIRLTARGGFSSLPAAERASGEIAAQVAWESGLPGLSSDKLTAILYEQGVEIYGKVLPNHRIIEGTAHRDSIEPFFNLVKRYSTEKHFTREGFQKVLSQTKASLQGSEKSRFTPFEEWLKLTHTQEIPSLKSLSLKDLQTVDYERSKQFFEESFSNPSEFVCVIVGDFDLKTIVPLIETYLGSISPRPTTSSQNHTQFPEGIRIKPILASNEMESQACLTFPYAPIKDSKQLQMAKLIEQVLELRLRPMIAQRFGTTLSSVSLELPLYPSLNLTWLKIQYRSEPSKTQEIKQLVLEEIARLATKGASLEELKAGLHLLRQKEALWEKDNQYWLSMLSDYFLREWEWSGLQQTAEMEKISEEQFIEGVKSLLKTEQYSFIYTSKS